MERSNWRNCLTIWENASKLKPLFKGFIKLLKMREDHPQKLRSNFGFYTCLNLNEPFSSTRASRMDEH